ncbi:MAG: CehA/McbA family metallohydrolase, partial [Myxococcota bacterium]|nr:CehA/McbA family metallohydrolase [Myxococcota bacterium]
YMTAVVERPGRVFGPGPYGGNLIDFGRNDLREDNLGETIPFFQFGLTAEFTEVRIVNDGSDGQAAVLEAIGYDNLWDYVNIQSFMPELLSYKTDEHGEPSGLLKFDPIADLPLQIRARYTLEPNAQHLEVRYYLRNLSDELVPLHTAFGIDMRGAVEPFVSGRGFSDPGVDLNNVEELLSGEINQPFIAYQTQSHSIGVRSVDFLGDEEIDRMSIGVVGVALFFLGSKNLLEFLSSPGSLELAGGTEQGFGFDLYLGDDVNDVHVWSMGDASWGEISGRVIDEESGEGLANLRVAAINPQNGDVESAFLTDAQGQFSGTLPVGDYHITADDLTRTPDPGQSITLSANAVSEISISLASHATLNIEVQSANDIHATTLDHTPCRVLLFGSPQERQGGICGTTLSCDGNDAFRHYKSWELDGNTPYAAHLRYCNTTMAPDEALKVIPGRYLVVISRGPEYDILQEVVDLSTNQTHTVSGVLHRSLDSTKLVASDYHVHQVASTDSVVPFEQRVLGFASNGIDFFASTDHDAITDLRPVVAELELQDHLNTLPGTEVSTIDLGHFNGWPIEPATDKNFGDPVDWAGGRSRPTPGELFDLMRERGAEVVQINHPRSSSSYLQKLQIIYDFENRTITANAEKAPSAQIMHMNPALPLFATNFDAMEIYNGVRLSDAAPVKRDWFNLLSMGHKIVGTGVSDSHNNFTRNPGDPRTYVMLENDAPKDFDVTTYIQNFLAGKAFISTGPVIRITATSETAQGTLGDLIPTTGALGLEIEVQTPTWYKVDTLNLYLNQIFVNPGAESDDADYENLEPDVTLSLLPEVLEWSNGGSTYRYRAELEISSEEL